MTEILEKAGREQWQRKCSMPLCNAGNSVPGLCSHPSLNSPTSRPWSQLYSTEFKLAGGAHDPLSLGHNVNSAVHSPSLVQRISFWKQKQILKFIVVVKGPCTVYISAALFSHQPVKWVSQLRSIIYQHITVVRCWAVRWINIQLPTYAGINRWINHEESKWI